MRARVGCGVPVRLATYNLHGGVDGWGRPTRVVDAAAALDADVLCCQEAWRSDTTDLAGEIAQRTSATAIVHPLATGARATGGHGSARWQPRGALLGDTRGIFLDSMRPLAERAASNRAAAGSLEHGEWCVAIVTRLPVVSTEVIHLRHLRKDRARRVLLVATLAHDAGPLVVFAMHGAHLSHGSLGQYREVARDLEALRPDDVPGVLGGDMNCWGPPLRVVLAPWRQAARGRTWPSWRPHSQIDHLFVRGPIEVRSGGPVDVRASDHRPLVATVDLAS